MFSGTPRFELKRRIGAGAIGIVYEAFDRERAAHVALKTLRTPAPELIFQLKQELRSLAGVVHPNLVALHELHAEGDAWFFTMELLDGTDLVEYVGTDEHRLRACLAQLVQGVAALHEAGRLHRDIKPSNVLVTADGRVVLLDFGVIAEIGRSEGAFVGTPAYAAPEQAQGVATPASDWYAVGGMLYRLLTGGLPFAGSSRAILYDKGRYPAQPVRERAPHAPEDLAALCDALLERDPAARPAAPDILRRLRIAPRRRWPRATEAEPSLIGRDRELAILESAFAEIADGRGSVVHVRGGSGVGKSALVRALQRTAERDGAVVLASRCYPQDSVPYKAVDGVVDVLARFLRGLARGEVDALLPRDILPLAQLFPVLGSVDAVAHARRRRAPALEPHELRRRAFGALRELIARIAEMRAVVIAIDDLQWGDSDSAPPLEALLAPPDPPAVLLVLAYRDEDRAPLVRALQEPSGRLADGPRAIEVALAPLPPEDACELATALLGSGDPRAAAVASSAGGIPFLICDFALALRDGAPSIGRAVADRLGALTAIERDVLELIAHAATPVARGVLVAAAGIEHGELEAIIAHLCDARLVRLTTADGAVRFESYHDRVREGVVARLSVERCAELHGRLADALGAAKERDLEALVVHCEGAGRHEHAADLALEAAEQARAALAFERAAELYRTALRLGAFDAAALRRVRRALGDVLAYAGHGDAAAEVYLGAAHGAPAADALELRRRAASQYLRTGRIEDGKRVLDAVLGELGEQLPRSNTRALMSIAWRRAVLRVRGRESRRVDATQIAAYDLVRQDTLWTAAVDLGMVELFVGADFATRQLQAALDLGEPVRVARGLVTEAMFLAAEGGRTRGRAEAVLAAAAALVADLDDPELPAWIACARGIIDYQRGRFRAALEHADAAVQRLREQCTGVLWQLGGVDVQGAWALFYLGRFRELAARVDAALEQARARNNRFDAANFGTGLPALAWAAADRTAEGREQVARAIAGWSLRGFHFQHYYALYALASFDLYDAEPGAAWDRIARAWPAVRESALLLCRSVALEAHHLRARAAIASGSHDGAIAAALRVCDPVRDNPAAAAFAALIRAGEVTDRDTTIGRLRVAVEACVRAELAAFAAAARRRLGELRGDRALIDAADRTLAAESVRAPAKLARMLVPLRAEVP